MGCFWAPLWFPKVRASSKSCCLRFSSKSSRGQNDPRVSIASILGQHGWRPKSFTSWLFGRNSDPYPTGVLLCAWIALSRSFPYFSRTWELCTAASFVRLKTNSGLSGLLVGEEEISLMTWVRLIGQVGSKDACMRLSLVSTRLSLVCARLSLDLIALCLHRLVSGGGADFSSFGLLLKCSTLCVSSETLSLSELGLRVVSEAENLPRRLSVRCFRISEFVVCLFFFSGLQQSWSVFLEVSCLTISPSVFLLHSCGTRFVYSCGTRFVYSCGTRFLYSYRTRFLYSLWTRFLVEFPPPLWVGLTRGASRWVGLVFGDGLAEGKTLGISRCRWVRLVCPIFW